MGCSSGALTEAGEYEAYGTPINYMHAGSPAVLATLWDVTDKDIDRFSKQVLQKWGLFKDRPGINEQSREEVGEAEGEDEGERERETDRERRWRSIA